MARTWDVPAMLRAMPAALFEAWMRYYGEEPWDAPAQAVMALGRRKPGIDGEDAEGLEAAVGAYMAGRG